MRGFAYTIASRGGSQRLAHLLVVNNDEFQHGKYKAGRNDDRRRWRLLVFSLFAVSLGKLM